MSFFFKSKKHQQDRSLSSRDGAPSSASPQSLGGVGARLAKEDKSSAQRSTPTGSLSSIDNDMAAPSPDQGYPRRQTSTDHGPSQPANELQYRNSPTSQQSPSSSLYPWSQRRLNHTSGHPGPFPRYGAAVNSVGSKEGDIYVMGGLINSQTVKGDLWLIEGGGTMSCYPLATTAEGPCPRVGHSSLLVGNAFIVFGGDTKIEEGDILDETLYLLNTSTRQWSRALPAGPRPSGRYGHSLNILGSKIYIFGGQVEGYFMNDLAAFDLNQLQMPNNRWEMLIPNSDSANAPSAKAPPARTNHSVVTYDDKMYLFGGTNGFQWFNDVWCYDPMSNSWSALDCIGYIPLPREGHAAALVDDVMYIFGGRTEEGADLGDLAAFRITSRRWYTFQNMGPSPSPRSGHSMTAVGKAVVVVGGEPSTPTATTNDLGLAYVLDTAKIRYPNDSSAQSSAQKTGRRPSQDTAPLTGPSKMMPSREGSQGPADPRKVLAAREASGVISPSGPHPQNNNDPHGQQTMQNMGARSPTAGYMSPPLGQPPQGKPPQGQPPNPVANQAAHARSRNASMERADVSRSPAMQSPVPREIPNQETPTANGRRTPTQAISKPSHKVETVAQDLPKGKVPRTRSQSSVDSVAADAPAKPVVNRPASPPPPTRQPSNPLSRRSSGRNSQTVALLKELDSARNRNAWYASELELARKSGYVPSASLSPVLESRTAQSFDDDDKSLIEALLAMRSELANVQASVDKQAILAAKQIAEADKQRDAAIQEAVYAKARLAAQDGSTSTTQADRDPEANARTEDMGRKLANALNTQKHLQTQIERLHGEVDAEKRARKLADDTWEAAQSRMTTLESYKQANTSEGERLKAELHAAQKEAREQSAAAAEAQASLQMLRVEKSDFESKYNDAIGSSKDHGDTFGSLREAMAASAGMKDLLEKKLAEERSQRELIHGKLNALKAEHEAQTAELVSTSQRLRDAEELAQQHAQEARIHREAVLSNLDKITTRDLSVANQPDTSRLKALQEQANAANALAKKYQAELNTTADRLRGAEERIAGLEAYQEQASRDGVSIRRQLQAALKDTQSLQAHNSDLRNQLAGQQLETNAMTVQHNTLKDILAERGISPTSAVRSRGSPRDASPEQTRVRDLEQQLAMATAAHEETKTSFASQANESEIAYREKLTQLENDYQSAVHYVKGTEKMLKQLKEQLSKYKAENSRLKTELLDAEDQAPREDKAGWENERRGLSKQLEAMQQELQVSKAALETQMHTIRQELEETRRDRETAIKSREEAAGRLATTQKQFEQLQQENAHLEQRAQDAEQKVGLLLDQVESSVDNYRRRSRQVVSMNSDQLKEVAPVQSTNGGHARNESSEAGSAYGSMGDARNSMALDNLANELETLRSHWEATNKNYRLSNTFEFDNTHASSTKHEGKDDDAGLGLSESLADWRKRLDD